MGARRALHTARARGWRRWSLARRKKERELGGGSVAPGLGAHLGVRAHRLHLLVDVDELCLQVCDGGQQLLSICSRMHPTRHSRLVPRRFRSRTLNSVSVTTFVCLQSMHNANSRITETTGLLVPGNASRVAAELSVIPKRRFYKTRRTARSWPRFTCLRRRG